METSKNEIGKRNIQQVTRIEAVKGALSTADFSRALDQAMPRGMTRDRMVRGALTAMQVNPDLFECDVTSLKLSMMSAAQFGLDLAPAIGEAYLVPFNDGRSGKKICTLIPGYKGLIKLAVQSPHVLSVRPEIVYENDKFEYSLGLNPKIEHIPARGRRGEAVYFYAIVKMRDGESVFQVWSKEQCLEHAEKHPKTFRSSNSKWKDPKSLPSMCLKTVIRAVLKYVPMSASDPLALALSEHDRHEEVIDASAVPLFESEETEADTSIDVSGDEPLPPNREFLKDQIGKLVQKIPATQRKTVTIPENLDECTTVELCEIYSALTGSIAA